MTFNPEQHVYKLGDKLLVVCEKNVFASKPLLSEPEKIHVSDLKIVCLTIEEERIVRGDYDENKQFYGYRAKGDDGNYYECQWKLFDMASYQPYQNWMREIVAGRDYVKVAPYKNEFGIETDTEWKDDTRLFLAWELAHSMAFFADYLQEEIAKYTAEKYPELALQHCMKEFVLRNDEQRSDPHRRTHHDTWHCKNDKCFYCEHDL